MQFCSNSVSESWPSPGSLPATRPFSMSAFARSGQGKSSGFRTLVATNKGNRWIFVFGFPKNEQGNIDRDEEDALKKLAAHLLSLTAQALATAQHAGELMEVNCDA